MGTKGLNKVKCCEGIGDSAICGSDYGSAVKGQIKEEKKKLVFFTIVLSFSISFHRILYAIIAFEGYALFFILYFNFDAERFQKGKEAERRFGGMVVSV